MPRASERYTIRFNAGSDSAFGYKGGGFDFPEHAMLAAWEVLTANDAAIDAVLYHGNMYFGKMGKDGRLFDPELRQIGICITHDEARMLI